MTCRMHVNALSLQVVILVGDLTYADNYFTNGTLRPPGTLPKAYQETYQPRWDAWGRFVEPLASQVDAQTLIYCPVSSNFDMGGVAGPHRDL